MKSIVAFCRIFVGVLFIFSGLIKANDPLGFSYKLDEYFEIFHMPFLIPLSVYMAMFICIIEIVLGVMVLLGSYMRVATWLLLLMIIFFTILTGYSAVTGKVTDCGCFGDAIKLTPWQSFWKDIVLLVLIGLLFVYRDRIQPLFSKKTNDALLGASTLAITAFTLYCFLYLPVKDFRPYRAGNDIREQMATPEGAPRDSTVTGLVYKDKTTGKQQMYFMDAAVGDTLPWGDSDWMANNEFVKQDNKVIRQGFRPPITDFHIWDDVRTDGTVVQNDMTAMVLDSPGYKLWIVAYNLDKTNRKAFDNIVQLARDAEQRGIAVYGLTSSPYTVTDPFRHEVGAAFPFYYADAVVLKTMVRSNPGLMLLDGSRVLGTWSHRHNPSVDDLLKRTERLPQR